MSNLGPDAQELLGQPAGAAPDQLRNERGQFVAKEGTPAEGAAPSGQPPAGEKMVPLAAVEGEQRAAASKMQRIRASLEPLGYQVLDDGTVIPPMGQPSAPQPSAPQVGVDPEVQEMAESLGIDPAKLQRVIDRRVIATGGAIIEPLSRHGLAQSKHQYAQDPDFPVYEKTLDAEIERRVTTLPPEYRGMARVNPELLADALAAAKSRHFDELVQRASARASGKIVGRFTEGAAPGPEGGTTPLLDPTTAAWAQAQGFTPEDMATAAKAKAEREGRR